MPPPTDMPNYVTRAELREELEQLDKKFEETLEQKFAPYGSLEAFGRALIDHMERTLTRFKQELNTDLARHAKAANEENRRYFEAMDDKYASLPARVERLETAVFPPKRQRRR